LPSQDHIPTMELSYLSIPKGGSTGVARSTASRIFAVTDGRGTSTIGDLKAEWSRGDVFVVPSWAPFQIAAAEDAMIFQVSDEPVLKMLRFFRDTPAN
jgi:gentisate 1,2-dioxygenase